MKSLPNPMEHRQADHPIEDIFLRRWSPRAMSGEPLDTATLNRLWEAARWAPSTFNEQEWRFLFAHRETAPWQAFFDLLYEANQVWCDRAGVLVVIAAQTVFTRNGKPNPVYSFDAGAAFENLALQGTALGLVVHAMAGFDKEQARSALKIPADYSVEAMIAIGHAGSVDVLPEEVKEREIPSGRKTVDEFVCEGEFQFD